MMSQRPSLVNGERLVETFLGLLRIDSPSGGEQELAECVKAHLRALGAEVDSDGMGNVIARLPGRGEPLLLNAHLDSVQPCLGIRPVVDGDIIRSDGRTVLGADDRAGVAVILEALRTIVERGLTSPPLEIVFTVMEEAGLRGAKELDYGRIRAREGLSLDSSGPVGTLVVAAPYIATIAAAVHGKAAHAGLCPERGVSAILVAAEAIARMPLGRIDEETTANIGTIKGGKARNIVPDRTELVGEARSLNEAKLEWQIQRMVEALQRAATERGAKVEVRVERTLSGFSLAEDEGIVQKVVRALNRLGIRPKLASSMGGSDANVFYEHGIKVVNLSVGFEDVHSTREWIPIEELIKCSEVLVGVLAEGN